MIQFEENTWTKGRTEGWTDPTYWTLNATKGGSNKV